jgi:photosystem II stability/assembly factor-like uncharacterized protein
MSRRNLSFGAVLLSIGLTGGPVHSQDHWQPIGPDGGGMYIIETHPSDSTVVYCSSEAQGFFLSTDKGLTWEARREGQYGFACRCIGPHPLNPAIIYLAGDNVYKTTDMGLTWVESHEGLDVSPNQFIYSLAVDARSDTLVYAGTFYGFYKSTNGGDYWELTSLEEWTWDIVIDSVNPSIVYAATKYGVYKSTDCGDTWELKTQGLDVVTFMSIVQAPGDSMRLYIAGGSNESPGRIYKTTDRCETWVDITDSLGIHTIYDLAVSSESADELYACVYKRGIYKSTDGGESWARSSEGMEYYQLWDMAIMSKEPEIVFTCDRYRGGVYRSTDAGASWRESNTGIRLFDVMDIEFIGEEKNAFLCATKEDGLKRYHLDEQRWEDIDIPCEGSGFMSLLSVYDIEVDPRSDSIFYLATDCGILKTTSGGSSWTNLYEYPGGPENDARKILVHPMNPDQIACLSIENERAAFLKSTDGGEEWMKVNWDVVPPHELLSDPSSPLVYYMVPGYNFIFYKTTDGGLTWTMKTLVPGGDINSMILDVNNPQRLYAALFGEYEGVHLSSDSGETWELIWDSKDPFMLAMDPVNSSILYCWLRQGWGVYKSTDGGSNWSDITYDLAEHILSSWGWCMKVHPVRRERLFAGTGDAGILVLEQSVSIVQEGDSPIPVGFSLRQNYPNPFNPSTLIEFDVSGGEQESVRVTLAIYDVRGRLIRILTNDMREKGKHKVFWDGMDNTGTDVNSGIYFCRISAGDFVATRKLLLLK